MQFLVFNGSLKEASRSVWFLAASLILCLSPAHGSANSKLKKQVKAHIKKTEQAYPIKKWKKRTRNLESKLEKVTGKFYPNPVQGVENFPYKKLKSLEKESEILAEIREGLGAFILEIKTDSILKSAFPQGSRVRSAEEARARSYIRLALTQDEPRRLKSSEEMLARCKSLEQKFRDFQADWMLNYARSALFQNVKEVFDQHHFSDNTRILAHVSERVKYHSGRLLDHPFDSDTALTYIQTKIGLPLKDLDELEKSLAPEMLYAGILQIASEGGVDFTSEAEKKIESLLQSLSEQNIKVIQMRKSRWFGLQMQISQALGRVPEAAANLEKRKQRKKEFKTYISDLTAPQDVTLISTETMSKALNSKTGHIKTSEIKSARKTLEVKVDSFDHGMAQVSKSDLKVKEGRQGFDRIHADEKEVNSLYVYFAPGGRADNNDLREFVGQVGLLSFGGSEVFLSYELPRKWTHSKKVHWQKVKDGAEKEKPLNREFSYVELVVEAHRQSAEVGYYEYVEQVYVPANMIVIFNPGGSIKRFESFSDIRNVKIKPDDLVDGSLYYKFLNYSVNGPEIYLNGIDHEIKLAKAS